MSLWQVLDSFLRSSFFHSSEFKHWSTSIATAKELTCAKFKGSHFVREHEAFVLVSSKNSS